MMKTPSHSTASETASATDTPRSGSCGLLAIAPATTFLAILIWNGWVSTCFGSSTDSGYCTNVMRVLGDGLGVIVMTGMFMAVGLTISTMLGGLLSVVLGKFASARTVIIAEFALGALIGALPFLMVLFGSS